MSDTATTNQVTPDAPLVPHEGERVYVPEGAIYGVGTAVQRFGHGTVESARPDVDGDVMVRLDDHAGLLWVRASQLVRNQPEDADAAAQLRTRLLRRMVSTYEEEWNTLENALHEKGDSSGWCTEFENIIEPLGFSRRPSQQERDYDVYVEVEVDVEIESPSSRFDSAVEMETNLTIDTSVATVTGSTDVTVTVPAHDEEEAENLVTEELVQEALDEVASCGGSSLTTVRSWSVTSASPAE